jgi:MurNAc alpha-1-phosphate uridylyltransferase
VEGPQHNLVAFRDAWDPSRMDMLLLVAAVATSFGYDGRGDFLMHPDGRLSRRGERDIAPFVYAGVAACKPALFADTPDGPFSLNMLFDRAIAAKRLYGHSLDGQWLHVGTPDAIAGAEARLMTAVA